MPERRNLSVRLTDEARNAWETLCTRRGVTATSLIEQLGLLLTEGVDWVPEEAIQRARRMDRQRYSRRPDS